VVLTFAIRQRRQVLHIAELVDVAEPHLAIEHMDLMPCQKIGANQRVKIEADVLPRRQEFEERRLELPSVVQYRELDKIDRFLLGVRISHRRSLLSANSL